jgi:hypothetical protein
MLIGVVAAGGAQAGFDVASLFEGGLFGEVWVSDPSYMYELTSDPTPNVIDTDPIGKIVGMVNGIEWPAAGTSNKPTYDAAERAMKFLGGGTLKYLAHAPDTLPAAFDNADDCGLVIVSKSAGGETSSPGARQVMYMADPVIAVNLAPHAYSPERACGSVSNNIGTSAFGSDYVGTLTGVDVGEYRVTAVNLVAGRVKQLYVNGVLKTSTNQSSGTSSTKRRMSLLGSGTHDMFVRGAIVRNAPFTEEEMINIAAWGASL